MGRVSSTLRTNRMSGICAGIFAWLQTRFTPCTPLDEVPELEPLLASEACTEEGNSCEERADATLVATRSDKKMHEQETHELDANVIYATTTLAELKSKLPIPYGTRIECVAYINHEGKETKLDYPKRLRRNYGGQKFYCKHLLYTTCALDPIEEIASRIEKLRRENSQLKKNSPLQTLNCEALCECLNDMWDWFRHEQKNEWFLKELKLHDSRIWWGGESDFFCSGTEINGVRKIQRVHCHDG